MKYKLGNTPRMTAEHNISSWNKVERKLIQYNEANLEQLIRWAEGHKHSSGANGFINYCITNGWIIKV